MTRRAATHLSFGGDLDLDAAALVLADRVGAVPGRVRMTDRVLLDTFDGRLRAAGLSAERPARGRAPAPSPEVAAAAAERVLLPVAHVRSRALDLAVLNGDEKTVVRLALEAPAVVLQDGATVALPVLLTVRGVLGYDAQLDRVLDALDGIEGVGPAKRPLFDAASKAAGRDPAGVSSKVKVKLAPGMRADAASGRLLGRLADVAALNLPGTLDDVDPEFLHDLRVAVRRARSVLRELKGVHPPARWAHLREELKWVQAVTGAVRDLDVQLLDWADLTASLSEARRADLEPLRALLVKQRRGALAKLRRDLRSARYAGATAAWRELAADAAATLADPHDPERPRAALPVEAVAADRVRAVHRRMVRDGARIGSASPDEDLHDLRKRGKELRYLLELFGGLFDQEVVRPMVVSLKSLQDVLGRFQDRAVQAELLRDAGRSLAAHDAGPDALMALGLLVEALDADQLAARGEFDERFAAFAARDQRRLVRATFPALGEAGDGAGTAGK